MRADGHEGPHLQGRRPRRAPAPGRTGPPQRATVALARRATNQGRQARAASRASLREGAPQRPHPARPNAWAAAIQGRARQTGLARSVVSRASSRAATRCLSQAIGVSRSARRPAALRSGRLGAGAALAAPPRHSGPRRGHRGAPFGPTAQSLWQRPVPGEAGRPRQARPPPPVPRPRPGGRLQALRAQCAWAAGPGAEPRGRQSPSQRS
jgi:hypothetical protein